MKLHANASSQSSKTFNTLYNKCKNVHGNRYTYDNVEFINITTPVTITCKIHGDFKQQMRNHLKGSNCPKCANITKNRSKRRSPKDFIDKCKSIHGTKYDYSLTKYNASSCKITIICPIHGNFTQRANEHLNGHGCRACNINKKFTSDPTILYIVRVHDKNRTSSAIKIGITKESIGINKRLAKENVYVDILYSQLFRNGEVAFLFEQYLHHQFILYRSTQKLLKNSGNTELFTEDVLDCLTTLATKIG